MLERPPILQGSERQQLAALRDYLVRLAVELENVADRERTAAGESSAMIRDVAKSMEETQAKAARARAAQLRELIIKTADTVRHEVDRITQILREEYVAVSEFGSFQETIRTTIEATARNIVESYDYAAAIRAVDSRFDTAEEYMTAIRGEIRRGLITDPETGEMAMGIAISEELSFTGKETTENGLVYYELSPGQTLGLYTATGWQFWINGSKRGWFDSVDGMLHVSNLAVENSLFLGGGWVMTMSDGLGIRYLG